MGRVGYVGAYWVHQFVDWPKPTYSPSSRNIVFVVVVVIVRVVTCEAEIEKFARCRKRDAQHLINEIRAAD